MQSNYKQIGEFIQLVYNRNSELKNLPLIGVTVNKKFIPSVANTIGTNMKTYKLIKKDQFACSLMQVRRDGKIPVALMKEDEAIISQAYPVFEIVDTSKLLPQYLMMWMSRSEFDREACFYAVGGVRGSLEWEDFCAMELPIPSIEKQKEIVKEYHTITDRIKLNEQLNQKLEDTAQAIYKDWFVDFEFPNVDGKPYKSSGGEMVYCDELDIEIPKKWKNFKFEDITKKIISHRGKSKDHLEFSIKDKEYKNPIISAMNVNNGKLVKHEKIKYVKDMTLFNWMKEPLVYDDIILTSEAPLGEMLLISKRKNYLLSQRLFGIRTDKKKCSGVFLYFWLQTPIAKRDLESRASGTTVMGIKLSELKKIKVLIPEMKVMESFTDKVFKILNIKESKEIENEKLNEFKEISLSKIATIKD